MPEDYTAALGLISQSLGRIETELSHKADKADVLQVNERIQRVEVNHTELVAKVNQEATERATEQRERDKRDEAFRAELSRRAGLRTALAGAAASTVGVLLVYLILTIAGITALSP